jgi:hypothetical protein
MRVSFAAATVIALVGVAACVAPTNLTASWKAPGTTQVRFNKVFVAAQSPDMTRRRAMEDILVKRIGNATPSYSVLTEEDIKDVDRVKAKVAAGGFDGAVVVRFVGTEKQTTYVPGTAYWGPAPYGGMYGYWGYGWGAAYSPGYLTTDTVVTLESNIYDVAKDSLIWSSRSETISPSSINELMQSVIETTVREMRKQKVL